MALNRLETLEKRLKKCLQTTAAYSEVILTHLKRVMLGKLMNYLSKSDWLTTKVRVVFDASAKYDGISLNDAIHSGPKLHRELFDVLLHFR